jgi:hypothetical protein
MDTPPSEPGGVHDRLTWELPTAVAVSPIGAPGGVAVLGVKTSLGLDDAPGASPDPLMGSPAAVPLASIAAQPTTVAAKHVLASIRSQERRRP